MSHTRLSSLGLAGRKSTNNNQQDSYIKTFEFDVNATNTASAVDTGVAVPAGSWQVISSYLRVTAAEATAVTKTLTVGTGGSAGATILGATDVSSIAAVGTPVTAAQEGGGNFTYTLAGTDFVELKSRAIVTLLCTD